MTIQLDERGDFPAATFGHPRPQLERAWLCLNGRWQWAKDATASWTSPNQVVWDRTIVVPYAPETPDSGVGDTGFFKASWYRRKVSCPQLATGERLHLHFGAVDYQAKVWVNGALVAQHEGGYAPFSADITENIGTGEIEIVVRAFDDPHDMEKCRGKQDWLKDAHAIWYARTSGIWQTVWLETKPSNHIDTLHWSSSVDKWSVSLAATICGGDATAVRVTLSLGGKTLVADSYGINNGRVERTIALPDPGIADARNAMTWHPDHPHLIDAKLETLDASGKVLDTVASYTALRSVGTHGDRFMLNGDVCRLRMALDQGYWEKTGLTAPNDAALKRDVELAKEAGFNAVRKHQKIEDPRFLNWADKLGLMVWEEMPSPYSFSSLAVKRFSKEWMEALERDASHPCIVAWVPFNESWGVPDLPVSAAQRNFVRGIYALTKAFDTSRPVISNSGWEAVDGDIITVHDYDSNAGSFGRRYEDSDAAFATLFDHLRPGGKALLLDGTTFQGKPILIDEMGGVQLRPEAERTGEGSWGYSEARTADDLLEKYRQLVTLLRHHPRIAGFCWTQLTDTYQEANGLFTMDRKPKVDLGKLKEINNGGVIYSA